MPTLKGIAVDTTDTSWINLDYCKEKKIIVSIIPKSNQRETIAEHTWALLHGLAKKILQLDRKTQQGKYALEMGITLKGKTLGIIGLGSIGSRVAEIADCFGMKVLAYNRSIRHQKNVEIRSFKDVLRKSDAISLHLSSTEKTKGIIGENELKIIKKGALIVNTADRLLVNEQAMASAIKSGHVGGYIYEAEDLENTPLSNLQNAVGLKSFGWYTKEALENLFEIWVDNIESMINNNPKNRIV